MGRASWLQPTRSLKACALGYCRFRPIFLRAQIVHLGILRRILRQNSGAPTSGHLAMASSCLYLGLARVLGFAHLMLLAAKL